MDKDAYWIHTGSTLSNHKYFIACKVYCLVSDEESEWTLSLSTAPTCLDQTMFSHLNAFLDC